MEPLLLLSPLYWLDYISNRAKRVLGSTGDSTLDQLICVCVCCFMAAEEPVFIFQRAGDQQAFTGVATLFNTCSDSHTCRRAHMCGAHACTNVSARTHTLPRQLLSINSGADEAVSAVNPTCDLREWISGFTGRTHNLPCFIMSPISASKDDEWLGVLIELNID